MSSIPSHELKNTLESAPEMSSLPTDLKGTDPQAWDKAQTRSFLRHVLGDADANKYEVWLETGFITGEILFTMRAEDLITCYGIPEEHVALIANFSGKSKRQDEAAMMVSVHEPSLAPLCGDDHFPYGNANFINIRRNGQFWIDNTRHILNVVENNRCHQMLLRPPRWGKSLLINMLECYLDFLSASTFDTLFGGTEIYAKRGQLKHNNKYHVMKMDLSIDIENGNFDVIYGQIQAEIERSIFFFCEKYNIPISGLPTGGALSKLRAVIHRAETLGHQVFILVDEYDRFANKLMFESPDAYNKVVAGQTGEALSSPVRSLFEAFKTLPGIRTFITGLSPVALADTSSVNFIENISDSPSVGDIFGLSEEDVRAALELIFGNGADLEPLLRLVKKFYNGFYFRARTPSGMTQPLYHTQLCLYFFKRLCDDADFSQHAFAGTLGLHEMIDTNTEVSENVINLLIRQREFAGIISELASGNLVTAQIAKAFRLRELLSETSSPDLLISFMRWHGLLTMDSASSEMFRIPNQVVGDAKGLLYKVVAARRELKYNVRSLINAPTEEKLWELHNEIFATMGSRFDHAYSEGAVVACAEAVLQSKAFRLGFQVFCEFVTLGKKRADLVLVDSQTRRLLVLEYKRLRPGDQKNAPDLDLSKTVHFHATNVVEANSLLMELQITESKRWCHDHAETVRILFLLARVQVNKYANELKSGRFNGYQTTAGVVIHATSNVENNDFKTVIGTWIIPATI